MKLIWNFLVGGGGEGAKQKTFHGESMDIFWKYMYCWRLSSKIYNGSLITFTQQLNVFKIVLQLELFLLFSTDVHFYV